MQVNHHSSSINFTIWVSISCLENSTILSNRVTCIILHFLKTKNNGGFVWKVSLFKCWPFRRKFWARSITTLGAKPSLRFHLLFSCKKHQLLGSHNFKILMPKLSGFCDMYWIKNTLSFISTARRLLILALIHGTFGSFHGKCRDNFLVYIIYSSRCHVVTFSRYYTNKSHSHSCKSFPRKDKTESWHICKQWCPPIVDFFLISMTSVAYRVPRKTFIWHGVIGTLEANICTWIKFLRKVIVVNPISMIIFLHCRYTLSLLLLTLFI